MTMTAVTTRDAAELLFRSRADSPRLALLRLLADGERRVVDLPAELDLAQSTVSGHHSCLRASGLLSARIARTRAHR